MNLKGIFKIDELIQKKISGSISPDEELILEEWVSESKKNEERLDKYLNGTFLSDIDPAVVNKEDTVQAWAQLQNKLEREQLRRTRIKFTYRVAAVLIPFVVMVTIVINYQSQDKNSQSLLTERSAKQKSTPIEKIVKSVVKPAVIVLADGSTVELKEENRMIEVSGDDILVDNQSITKYDSTKKNDVTYSVFRVPRGAGEYCMNLSDGTKVWLNADSEIKFPNKFVGDERVVTVKGELFFDVAKDKGRKFIVKTSKYDIEVLGTKFNVRSYDNEEISQTTLVTGKVAIKTEKEVISMVPGDMCSLSGHRATISKVDVEESISWTTGNMKFKDKTLGYILECVSRWYDLTIVYKDETLKDIVFSGSFKRYDNLNIILDMLREAGEVNFIQSGNEIFVK